MKKTRKSLVVLFLSAVVVLFAGCNQNVKVHNHTFAVEWTSDAEYHWHAATCEHTTEVSDKAEHTFGEYVSNNDATTEADGTKTRKCTVCQYEDTVTDEGSRKEKQGEIVKASWMSSNGNLVVNGTEIAKTSEVVVIPAGTTATIEMTDDTAWSNWVSSSAHDSYKGVFLKGRKVKLSPFVMSQYEVTRDLYKAVMGRDPSTATSHETKGENPVNYVNWFNAIIFCNKLSALEGLEPVYSYNFNGTDETDPDKWLNDKANLGAVPTDGVSTNCSNWIYKVKIDITKNGYRLPTEAEWEFAARGGDPAKAAWKYAFSGINVYGSNKIYGTTTLQTDSNLATVGWYKNNSSGTHGVGLKKANPLNLYDMSGNVWEWCNDSFDSTATKYDSAYTKDGYVTDPLGGGGYNSRCLRGGSWDYYAYLCAVSYRSCQSPWCCGYKDTNNRDIGLYGFRVCRSTR